MKINNLFEKKCSDNCYYVCSMYLRVCCNDLWLGREHFIGRHTLNECKCIWLDINADELNFIMTWTTYMKEIVLAVKYVDQTTYNNVFYERFDNVWYLND